MKKRVGFVQFDSGILQKRRNLENSFSLAEGLRADLIVFPELFNSGYAFKNVAELASMAESVPEGETTQALLGLSRRKHCCLVAGIAEKSAGKFYNSAAVVCDGEFLGVYRKTHLYGREKKFFSQGDTGFKVFNCRGMKIGVMICFDWFFPESVRTLALAGADVVAQPANLVLPYCPESLKTRCLENRVFAVMADVVGKQRGLEFQGLSEVVGPDGKVLRRASASEPEAGAVQIDLAQARDKKLKDGNDVFADRRPEFYHS